MSPGEEREEQRQRLIRVAANALEREGPSALQTKRLTAEVGKSTQAIYTLFGGLPGLLDALSEYGFRQLADAVRAVPETDDAVADFLAQGGAYAVWALTHPQLYRLMFGLEGERRHLRVGAEVKPVDTPEANAGFAVLTGSVERMQAAGRVKVSDTTVVAGQFLSATHGYVLLETGGVFGEAGAGLRIIAQLSLNLLVGLGDTRRRAERSLAKALPA